MLTSVLLINARGSEDQPAYVLAQVLDELKLSSVHSQAVSFEESYGGAHHQIHSTAYSTESLGYVKMAKEMEIFCKIEREGERAFPKLSLHRASPLSLLRRHPATSRHVPLAQAGDEITPGFDSIPQHGFFRHQSSVQHFIQDVVEPLFINIETGAEKIGRQRTRMLLKIGKNGVAQPLVVLL